MLHDTTVPSWSAYYETVPNPPFQTNVTLPCRCEPSPAGDDVYRMVNLLLIWIALPCITSVEACVRADSRPFIRAGIVTNIASVTIYTHAPIWQRSSGRYLTALSASDLCVCVLSTTDFKDRRVPSSNDTPEFCPASEPLSVLVISADRARLLDATQPRLCVHSAVQHAVHDNAADVVGVYDVLRGSRLFHVRLVSVP
jgi:hypothetical protein